MASATDIMASVNRTAKRKITALDTIAYGVLRQGLAENIRHERARLRANPHDAYAASYLHAHRLAAASLRGIERSLRRIR